MEANSAGSRRQRSRIACERCRQYRRKCTGDQPCDLCRGFGYECHFRRQPRKPRRNAGQASSARPETSSAPLPSETQTPSPLTRLDKQQPTPIAATSDSNSGPAFAHAFALTVDPNHAPPFQMLGWNVFLGERCSRAPTPPLGIPEILTQASMNSLTEVYFNEVDPCYGFLDRGDIEQRISRRWQAGSVTIDDAILCGVASIACLFSGLHELNTEALLAELLKSLLDLVVAEPATVDIAIAWILRTVYLRLTSKPDEGWLTSCMTLHIVDSARLQCEPDQSDHFQHAGQQCSPDIRRRMFGVAQHLNVWMSFDLGRSRVRLQNASSVLPASRPGDYTTELLELLPLYEKLDPSANLNGDDLLLLLDDVLGRIHTQAPSILAQCNLMLCIFRRLHAVKRDQPPRTLARTLDLIGKSLDSANAMIEAGNPWHQLSNVPFHSICALLVVDSAQSFALLQPALSCMERLNQKYDTRATSEILHVARTLINLHQKRRRSEVQRQSEMLDLYPTSMPTVDTGSIDPQFEQAVLDMSWFDEMVADSNEIYNTSI